MTSTVNDDPITGINNNVSLIPIINSTGDIVLDTVQEKCTMSEMLLKEYTNLNYPDVMIIFLIRRPGCGGCRENGQLLSQLAKEYSTTTTTTTRIGFIGIIKEIHEKNYTALIDFYQTYFHYPIYIDQQRTLFQRLGGGSGRTTKLSIVQFLLRTPQALIRYKKKQINNVPFGGDIFTLGGLLIYNNDSKLYTQIYEKYGEPFDKTILKSIIRNCTSSTQQRINE